ncbi:hypothetical protein [Paenibacillus sp. IITD108]|uniref:hypothetical protein n=1 Tax=Paenibacillus sp. IITD108 TaxID=3116649 RepID=UPI002F41DE78
MMRKLTLLVTFLLLFLNACDNNQAPKNVISILSEQPEIPSTKPTASAPPTETNKPTLLPLTEQEIYDVELLRLSWTREQMNELGLEKIINEGTAETIYSNEDASYSFFDFYSSLTTPAFVSVYGDIAGPRNIRVGDSFEDVLNRFPVEQDWKISDSGLFYGQFDYAAELKFSKLTGRVADSDYADVENGKKIVLCTEEVLPALTIHFANDVVTHFTIITVAD